MTENTLYQWDTDDDLVGERVIIGTTDGAKRGVVLATCKSLLKVKTAEGVYLGKRWEYDDEEAEARAARRMLYGLER